MKQRALIAVEKGKFRPFNTNRYHSVILKRQILDEECAQFYTYYGIELPASTRIVRVEAVVNLVKFLVYKLSLRKRDE
jgi:hypothetical protein